MLSYVDVYFQGLGIRTRKMTLNLDIMVSFLTDNFAPEESRLDYFIYFIRVYILFSILARDRTTFCAWITCKNYKNNNGRNLFAIKS